MSFLWMLFCFLGILALIAGAIGLALFTDMFEKD
jgi:multisubunit Na+/H+ antiporter MnhG subunit